MAVAQPTAIVAWILGYIGSIGTYLPTWFLGSGSNLKPELTRVGSQPVTLSALDWEPRPDIRRDSDHEIIFAGAEVALGL
jgi:hypothetical protein